MQSFRRGSKFLTNIDQYYKNRNTLQFHPIFLTIFHSIIFLQLTNLLFLKIYIMNKIQSIEKICTYHSKLRSPVETDQGIFMVSENGDILKYADSKLTGEFIIIGQPSSIAFNAFTEESYISDFAHQSIVNRKSKNSGNQNISNEISEFNNENFLGPNSVVITQNDQLFFSDSGPFCQSSLEDPIGSIFLYLIGEKTIKALAHRCLAYPTGLAYSADTKQLYACEMAKNRIIRFVFNNNNYESNFSTFYQFGGRFGPSAICLKNELLYVSLFEFKQLSSNGIISVLNFEGELLENIVLPGSEISGICFSLNNPKFLYVTENSNQPVLLKVTFKGDKSEEREQITK